LDKGTETEAFEMEEAPGFVFLKNPAGVSVGVFKTQKYRKTIENGRKKRGRIT